MRSKKFGFLGHYKRIKIEGVNPVNIINKCIKDGITLKNIKYRNSLESTAEIKGYDFDRFKKLTGHSYRMTVLKEGGIFPLFRSMKANIVTVAGAFLLGVLIFYQSLFVAEIRVDGYRAISEESLRETMAQAGLYEGAVKEDDYEHVKMALYRDHSSITWVNIFQEGRLIKVSIAEAGKEEEEKIPEEKPANIVAVRSGMIEKITPLQGNAKVQKGDYVNKGDVLISGRYRYQSSDYSRGDGFFNMYSHAKGQVLAKTPANITYYFEKNKREKEPTGRAISGIYIKFGDKEIDTAKGLCKYEVSVRNEKQLINLIKPVPLTVSLVRIEEVKLTETLQSRKKISKVVEAAIRQYEKDKLEKGEKITGQTIDYYEGVNTIKASVLLEVMEDIGQEKEIKVKKNKKEKEQNQ